MMFINKKYFELIKNFKSTKFDIVEWEDQITFMCKVTFIKMLSEHNVFLKK